MWFVKATTGIALAIACVLALGIMLVGLFLTILLAPFAFFLL